MKSINLNQEKYNELLHYIVNGDEYNARLLVANELPDEPPQAGDVIRIYTEESNSTFTELEY